MSKYKDAQRVEGFGTELILFKRADGSANAGASLDRPVYQLTDNRSIALRHSLHRKVNSNVAIEASATIESAYRSYFLPEGVLLSNGITRLSDPITPRANTYGMRPELFVMHGNVLGHSSFQAGAGVGLSI